MSTGRGRWFIGVLTLLLSLSSQALTGQEFVVPLQFSFSDPGARSLGFGGAFVALADDATAAFANPAGLVQLARPEVSIEARRWSYSTPFVERGRLENLPSGFGIDTTEGLAMATSDDDLTGVSLLSAAYPGDTWTLAVFRHQLANFEFLSETQGLFSGGTTCCQTRELDQRATTSFEIVTHGIAGAYRIRDRLAVGLALVHYDASLLSDATLFLPDNDSLSAIFAANSYLPQRSVVRAVFDLEDTDWAFHGGVLWRLSERWRFGAVYRQGPEFDVVTLLRAGEAIDFGVPPGGILFEDPRQPIRFPWIVGWGLAYRGPDERLTVSFQMDHIEYSRLLAGLQSLERTVDDVREIHLGGEYAFLGTKPIVALRLGAWLEPDHQIRATRDANPILRGLQPPGDDEIHVSAGLGVALERLQIDLGFDLGDRADTISVSTIFNF